MLTVTLPLKSINHIKVSLDTLIKSRVGLAEEVKELEDQPRHLISHESIVLAQKTTLLKSIDSVIRELKELEIEIGADFATLSDVNAAISSSQPYNPGSRENY